MSTKIYHKLVRDRILEIIYNDSLTEENNIHKADQKFKYYEQEIAKATRTNTALRKKELMQILILSI